VILIAEFIVNVAIVVVSTEVPRALTKVTIARYLYLFIAVVKVPLVNVGVVNPLPLDTSLQETEAAAVVVSDATCHLILLVVADGVSIVVSENELVSPTVVVSLTGLAEILPTVNVTSLVEEA
jgi:hypothetical protein